MNAVNQLQPPQMGNPALGNDVRTGNQIDLRNADPRGRLSNLSQFDIAALHGRDINRDVIREIERKFECLPQAQKDLITSAKMVVSSFRNIFFSSIINSVHADSAYISVQF